MHAEVVHVQAVMDFTIVWLERLHQLWEQVATEEDPVSSHHFRTAGQTSFPPNTKICTAGTLTELFQGRDALMHSALYVTEMVDEWTCISHEADTTCDTIVSGVMKHVSKITPTADLKQIMGETMRQWAVCIQNALLSVDVVSCCT